MQKTLSEDFLDIIIEYWYNITGYWKTDDIERQNGATL